MEKNNFWSKFLFSVMVAIVGTVCSMIVVGAGALIFMTTLESQHRLEKLQWEVSAMREILSRKIEELASDATMLELLAEVNRTPEEKPNDGEDTTGGTSDSPPVQRVRVEQYGAQQIQEEIQKWSESRR